MNEPSLSDAVLAELLTLTMTVDEVGTIRYFNQQGQLHRIHGPAIIWPDGEQWWYQGGTIHRTDGLAIEGVNGRNHWFIHGHELTEQEFNERIKSI